MKRVFDVSAALAMLVFLSPLMIAVAVMIKMKMGSPVVFSQRRPGYKGGPFDLHKFRTMTDVRGEDGELLPDEERLTDLGIMLRKYSLDELPQLINVLRGELSLVGPRPLLPQYMELYSRRQMKRHDVRPGITGWAQVNGRNRLSWEEKFEMDVWYVENRSFWLDIKIIAMTAGKVLKSEGISQEGESTARAFTGNTQDD
ncbi:sugar transferase [Salinicoccus sediminis]|uniref:Sugar transferase n=1 Tax=Salinicoccus sediminis TaxID=1432562 RepID=A0A0M2SJS6_9STAP|nr:sugar transferase [Salinicoccus sediminis]KKK33911.1 sugar transferase [Salinicoccus sediminis]